MDYFTRVLRSEIYLNRRTQHSLHLLHINIKELIERCCVICYYFKGVAIFWRFWPILAGTESRFFTEPHGGALESLDPKNICALKDASLVRIMFTVETLGCQKPGRQA
jgi:hypothetical protein